MEAGIRIQTDERTASYCDSRLVSSLAARRWTGRAAPKRVGHPVMRSHAAFRNVIPPSAPRHVIAALRMERVVDAIVGFRLSSHEQQDIVLAVVQEAMGDAGPRRKGRKVPGPHRVKNAVYPGINLTLEDVHELLFFLLGMRPRTSLPGASRARFTPIFSSPAYLPILR